MSVLKKWHAFAALTAIALAGCGNKGDVPSCASQDVISMVDDMIRKSAIGHLVKSTSKHQEVSYDPASETRKGQCEVKTETETIIAKYSVKLLNKTKGTFQVEVEPIFSAELLSCTSEEVKEMVKEMIQENLKGRLLSFVSEYRETRYDPATKTRTGDCRVKTTSDEFTVTYQVKPINEKFFEVWVISGLGSDPLVAQRQTGQPSWQRPNRPFTGRPPDMVGPTNGQPGRLPGQPGRLPGQPAGKPERPW